MITETKIKQLKKQFKGRGNIFSYGIKYLNDKVFFVNKQFDNKNFSPVSASESRKSQSVLGTFKTKKSAIEFGIALGLELIDEPVESL